MFKDLTGQLFGRLKVIQQAERRCRQVKGESRYDVMWLVECQCPDKKQFVASSSALLGKDSRSCGCLLIERKKDLTNQVFGKLKVVREFGRNKRGERLWLVECQCKTKNRSILTTNKLSSGRTKSCGCLARELQSSRKKKNLTGRTFGRLKVIQEVGQNNHGNIIWLVECQCGNRLNVIGAQLTQGKTKSCGCLARELTSLRKRKDLTGRTFGRLKVIQEAGKTENILWLVECQCDKRTKFVVKTSRLLSGNANSCGCLVMKNKMVAARETAKKRIKLDDCFNEFVHFIEPTKLVKRLEKQVCQLKKI